MELNGRAYLIIVVVATVSFLLAWTSGEEIHKVLLSTPGAISLVGALFVLSRDILAHERKIKAQSKEHLFKLSVTSHMAEIAFDKHIAFCEEYLLAFYEITSYMFGDGPSKNAKEWAKTLNSIRRKHGVWLTKEINEKLEEYESALHKIGIKAELYESNVPVSEDAFERLYDEFTDVLGIETNEAVPFENKWKAIIDHIQSILKVNEFIALREEIVAGAMEHIKGKSST